MPICDSCNKTLVCHECGATPGPQYNVVGNTVLACKEKAGIWVRVRDEAGKSVPGVKVDVSGTPGKTGKTGFATYDDVEEKEHTVTITVEGDLAKLYKTEYAPLTGTVDKGDVKIFAFVLLPKAKPVIKTQKPAVAVKGTKQELWLSADQPYKGQGVFTCTKGAAAVKFHHDGGSFTGTKTFPAITEARIVVEVEAVDASAFEGLEFEWKIDDDEKAATAKMTAVKATLIVYDAKDAPLSDVVKAGDGRTIHLQNKAKERARAKAEIDVQPPEFKGNVLLSLTKPTVELYDKAKDGDKADLSAKIPVGTGQKPTYFVEGVALSTAKADTSLELKLDELSEVVDACKLTVMETRLHICAPRVDWDNDPLPMPEDQKLAVGRTLIKQRTEQTGKRALLRVTKSPLDAPCPIILKAKAGGAKVTLFEDTFQKTTPGNKVKTGPETQSNEVRSGPATEMKLPRTIKVDEIKDLAKGLAFWLEGTAVSTAKEVTLQVDVEGVDELCDAVACTVVQPKLSLEIKRQDNLALVADVELKVTAPGSDVAILTRLIPRATGKLALELEAGFYGLALNPKSAMEKEMRLMRTVPDHAETSLDVFGDMTVKFELLPPYEKVQCVGYFMRTGAYLGVDGPSVGVADVPNNITVFDDLRKKKRLQALNDIDGRCEIMKNAVAEAYTTMGVLKDDPKVLKIFMAPEFYFRGKQGAYPLEAISEIMVPPKDPVKANIAALKTELDDPKYNDWLFVLGSAIGSIELDDDVQRTEVTGKITAVKNSCKVNVWVETASPSSAATNGWRIYISDSGISDALVSGAVSRTSGAFSLLELEMPGDPPFSHELPVALSEEGIDAVTFMTKHVLLELDCPSGPPAVGWDLEQAGHEGEIVQVIPVAGTHYGVWLKCDEDVELEADPADITDGSTTDAVDIVAVIKTDVEVSHPAGSPVEHAAADWRFWTEPGAGPVSLAANESFLVKSVAPGGGPDELLLTFDGCPAWNTGDTLVLGDLFPADEVMSEKLVTIEVQFTAVTVVAKGHFLEVGAVTKGLVESVTDLTGNKFRIDIWMRLDRVHALTVGTDVVFSTPGTAEIVNIALVRKGGKGTPVRTDGGAQKELLVYKESVSSVDFEGIDYSRRNFGQDDRRVIALYGDPSRRAKATVGASNAFSTSANVPGSNTPSGKRITETNRSGLGGGSIFTMDGITFGLEVCLDHLMQKLVAYFNGLPGPPVVAAAAVPGEPKIQVQLIPSCGMSITDGAKCTVADGIIFNVDAYEYGCEKDGGTTKAAWRARKPLHPPTAATYFITTETAKSGSIEVYEAIDKPTPGVV